MWRGQLKLIFYLTVNLFKKDDSSQAFTDEDIRALWVDIDVRKKGKVHGEIMRQWLKEEVGYDIEQNFMTHLYTSFGANSQEGYISHDQFYNSLSDLVLTTTRRNSPSKSKRSFITEQFNSTSQLKTVGMQQAAES